MSYAIRSVVLALLAIVFAGACAGSHPPIDAAGARALQTGVTAARTAAARGDTQTALQSLFGVRETVAALLTRGEITKARADEIVSAAAAVETALRAGATTTVAPTTTVPPRAPPSTAAPPPTHHGHHGHGDNQDEG